MKILFFNYMGTGLPTLIQSFELARSASKVGHNVKLFFMHKQMQYPQWVFDMLDSSKTERFSVEYTRPSTYSVFKHGSSEITSKMIIKSIIGGLRFIFKEIKIILSNKPDVIIVRPDHVLSFVFSSLICRKPLILCTDGPIEELDSIWGYKAKWPVFIDSIRASFASSIIYISETCRQFWIKKNIAPSTLFFCPNAADPSFFLPQTILIRTQLKKKYKIPEKAVVLGFSGNQRFWHGLPALFKAYSELSKNNSNLHLHVVGAIEDPSSSGFDILPQVVKNHITFTGFVEYRLMPQEMDIIDIFVLPYPPFKHFHFSPMKMFEALSLGKFIVASSQGQLQELLSELPSVFLYNPLDSLGLSNAINCAIHAFQRSPETALKSRDFILSNHTWESRGDSIISACNHALRGAKQ